MSRKYNITYDMIDKELRVMGRLFRGFLSYYKENRFNLCNKLLRPVRGVWLGRRVKMTEEYVERADGSKLRLCVCVPKEKKENVPAVLWMHGGGYALGLPEQNFQIVNTLTDAIGCVTVLPDYRLSTEAPYPAALNDCYLALLWLKEHAAMLGTNPMQIFTGGDSAGGGLCAALSTYARDKGGVNIAFQMPLYPMIDDRETQSSKDNDAPIWSGRSNREGWKMYLGDLYGTEDVPKYAAPSRETDYTRLPPTLTYVGTIEPFYDETVKYVNDLKDGGVEVFFREYKGCYHAFSMVVPKSKVAKDANAFVVETVKYAAQHFFKEQK